MRTIYIAICFGLLFLVLSPAQGHETIVEVVDTMGAGYIYIYNKTDGSPDRLTVVDPIDPDVLEYFCTIPGILKVTLNGVEYTCDPEKWTK